MFDSTMIVIGVMIGSGIFIVPADMGRLLGGPGWLLAAWVFTAILTVAAALSFGELASMMPGAGGMYLYLREAYSPLWALNGMDPVHRHSDWDNRRSRGCVCPLPGCPGAVGLHG